MDSTAAGPAASEGTSGPTTGTDGSTTAPADSTGTALGPCEAGCANVAECGFGSYEDCLLECEDFFEQVEGALRCVEAATASWECLATAACDTLERDCAEFFEAEYIACDEALGCVQDIGGAIDGSSCTIFQSCGDGLERLLECADGTCTCIDQKVVTGSCQQESLCLDLPNVPIEQSQAFVDDFLLACCGWDPAVPPIDQ